MKLRSETHEHNYLSLDIAYWAIEQFLEIIGVIRNGTRIVSTNPAVQVIRKLA